MHVLSTHEDSQKTFREVVFFEHIFKEKGLYPPTLLASLFSRQPLSLSSLAEVFHNFFSTFS
jgi:hypothetical protein